MFGLGKSGKSGGAKTMVVYDNAPTSDRNDVAFKLEVGAHLPDVALDLTNRIPDTAKNLAGRTKALAERGTDQAKDLFGRSGDQARDLAGRGTDQAKGLRDRTSDAAKSLSQRLPDRDTAFAWVDKLPEPVRDRANERLGRKRRSRWWTVAMIAAIVGGAAAALLIVKRVFAPGYEEEPLYSGGPDRPGGTGEPVAYPAEGSGTGWPQPQRTPESTETVDRDRMTTVAVQGTTGRGTERTDAGTPVMATPHLSGGNGASMAESPSSGSPSGEVMTPAASMQTTSSEQQQGQSAEAAAAAGVAAAEQAPAGSFYALESRGGEAVPAAPSEPAQRSEAPFSERQAEMNARLQLKQDELYAAFPGMSREDIVASDGYLDRLAEMLAPRSGMNIADVRSRLDAILGTSPADATNPVLPDRDQR